MLEAVRLMPGLDLTVRLQCVAQSRFELCRFFAGHPEILVALIPLGTNRSRRLSRRGRFVRRRGSAAGGQIRGEEFMIAVIA